MKDEQNNRKNTNVQVVKMIYFSNLQLCFLINIHVYSLSDLFPFTKHWKYLWRLTKACFVFLNKASICCSVFFFSYLFVNTAGQMQGQFVFQRIWFNNAKVITTLRELVTANVRHPDLELISQQNPGQLKA